MRTSLPPVARATRTPGGGGRRRGPGAALVPIALLAAAAAAAGAVGEADPRTSSGPSLAWLVVYRPGPAWRRGAPLAEQPLEAHGRYMLDLYRRGILQLAGPFADDSGGALLFRAPGAGDARALVEADPAVAGGVFVYELRPWRLLPWEELSARGEGSR